MPFQKFIAKGFLWRLNRSRLKNKRKPPASE